MIRQLARSAAHAANHSLKLMGIASEATKADVVDCVVIGAGVIGLACARAAALKGYEVVILEAESTIGSITSSRHSEVIHAGIYYPRESWKARLCVEGKWMLYDYCKDKGIPYKQLGKLIVATNAQQVPKLRELQVSAAANGVEDLAMLSSSEAHEMEPALLAAAALLSPSTGILDSHQYMQCLLDDAVAAGAALATHSRFLGAQQVPATSYNICGSSNSSTAGKPMLQLSIKDSGSGQIHTLNTRWMVNAAGLSAQAVAASINPQPAPIPQLYLAKGNYFSLTCKAPFSRLIYPVPQDGGLGVHLTLDLAGQARFGPDVEWLDDAADYQVDPRRGNVFYPAIRAYYPGLPDGALQPSYSGIRPKLSGPGQPAGDFVFQGPRQHGVAGLISLFGFESPGLTSSLAAAQVVTNMLTD